jgi:hypothetical protein
MTKKQKPDGYWTIENTIREAENLVKQHGEEALKQKWLQTNGFSGLAAAITKHGGFQKIRENLGISGEEKPSGYWSVKQTISEAISILEEHGAEAISSNWLKENGYKSLANAIVKNGGYRWILEELKLSQRKRNSGYWTKDKVILESKKILEVHGEDCLVSTWLKKNGYGSLLVAIHKNGNFTWIRQELGIANKQKPKGYWNRETTIYEAKEITLQYGEKALNKEWLSSNGYGGLNVNIGRYGGFAWIRSELGLLTGKKPRGYWTKQNTLADAKKIVEEHGESALNQEWLRSNGFGALIGAISRVGGMAYVRNELKLERGKRENGYWTQANTLIESKWILEKHGEDALRMQWLRDNFHSGLATAITKCGGFEWLRKELGLSNRRTICTATSSVLRRSTNIEHLRSVIKDLCLEGVKGFTPAQLVVVLQQAGFDKIPVDEGKDIYLALTKGLLLPEELIRWGKGDVAEPRIAEDGSEPIEESFRLSLDPKQIGSNASNILQESNEEGTSDIFQEHEDATQGLEIQLPPLAVMDPCDQLKFLDAEIFASADDEAIEALVSMGLHQLWAKAYLGPYHAEQVLNACQQFHPKRPWSKRLQQLFLEQLNTATSLKLPEGFQYRVDGRLVEPRLMQRHVASIAGERRRLLIMSDMGTGKSLAAQLSVMSDGATNILVIAINSCVNQWYYDFAHQWHGNHVSLLDMTAIRNINKGKLPTSISEMRNIWVIPSHLLSLINDEEAKGIVDTLNPDAIILDEVHIFKQREEANESLRRQQTSKLITTASEQNPELMVLGLSGTVITNSLSEGRTLLELVLGEERPDLPNGRGIAKAMRMHQALMANGIRQRAINDFPYVIVRPEVDATEWLEDVQLALRYPPRLRPLQVEKALIHARIPAILEAVDGPTVVVTQYVEGFVEPLRKAIKAAGYRVGVHTGDEKLPVHGHANAVEAFKAGALDVLIASINTISTGVDGLQNVSNNLIIACMPWTAADYLQVIARLARSGQEQPVRVVIPTTHINYVDDEIGPAQWSFCGYRASIIANKQRLMDAVMDGLVPESEEITEAKAGQQLVRWLERLDSKGALVRPFRPIRVPLVFETEAEEQKARAHFGNWSSCNGRWNSQASDKLHKRLQARPEEWELYHTDLGQMRKEWAVDPLQEAIKICTSSKGLVIGDFGCGTAELADSLKDRHTVHSFDHVAINDSVIACDIANGVPLEKESLDLAIFSLSLMGTNWKEQLVEAWRCLKPTGQIHIWTALTNRTVDQFCHEVERAGFKVITNQEHYKWLYVWGVRVNEVVIS